MSRLVFPLLMGLVGCLVLLSLGVWQVQRLAVKEKALAAIDARIADAPMALPRTPDPVADKYRAVQVTGTLTGQELYVLTSHDAEAGYRVIAVLETQGRRIMADLGFVKLDAKDQSRTTPQIALRGHLHWPEEVDGWTPVPDGVLWFGRDVAGMATALGTEPVLLIVAEMSPPLSDVVPVPIDSADIPNDHLGYAITWFSLAFVWAVMSGFFSYRMGRRPAKDQ